MCKVDGGTAVLDAVKGVGFRGTDGGTVGDCNSRGNVDI